MTKNTSKEALDALKKEVGARIDMSTSVGAWEEVRMFRKIFKIIEAMSREVEELEGSVKFFKKLCQDEYVRGQREAKTVTPEQVSKAFEQFHDVIGYHAERAIHEEDVNDFIKALGLPIQDSEPDQ